MARKPKQPKPEKQVRGLIYVDMRLLSSEQAKEALEKQKRRGYLIASYELPAHPELGEITRLILSPDASWWDVDMWKMLDAKVKQVEKEREA